MNNSVKRKLAAVGLAVAAPLVSADTFITGEGASCGIPEGFNNGPYDPVWNSKGMSPFCVFPAKPLADAIQEQLENNGCSRSAPPLPECGALVVSPSMQEYPCYQVVYE